MKSVIDIIPLFHEFYAIHKEGYLKYPDIQLVYETITFYSPMQDILESSVTDFIFEK